MTRIYYIVTRENRIVCLTSFYDSAKNVLAAVKGSHLCRVIMVPEDYIALLESISGVVGGDGLD